MKDEKLDLYIGKKVIITFYDNEKCSGTLGKGSINYDNEWQGKGYHLEEIRLGFRKTHVKKVEVI